VDDLVDSARMDTYVLCQTILADSEWFYELLQEDLSGVDGGILAVVHASSRLLMIVGNLNIIGVTVSPLEADPPSAVDPDTVLPISGADEPFQTHHSSASRYYRQPRFSPVPNVPRLR
jgi:hypothetical protein